jgi:parallel beta-helix repeat protein
METEVRITRRRSRICLSFPLTVLAFFLINFPVFAQINVQASTISGNAESTASCSSLINDSTRLSANLVCSDHGLIIDSSNISISLNGYSIIGPGNQSTKSGIIIPDSHNVTIYGPGIISNFQSGIFTSGSNGLDISSIFLDRNRIGVYLAGSVNSTLEHNMIKNNELGIGAHSSDNIQLYENYFNGNSLAGISLINSVDSSISQNYINGSEHGIFTDSASSSNIVSFNFLLNIIDVNSANGLSNDITNNTYEGNYCELSIPLGLCRGLPD